MILILFARELAGMYVAADDPNRAEVIDATVELMTFMLSTYFLCGIMDSLSGSLRGIGYSLAPMLMSIGCICVLRSLWVIFIFPLPSFNSLVGIYTIYPLSWLSASILMAITLIFAIKKIKNKFDSIEAKTISQ